MGGMASGKFGYYRVRINKHPEKIKMVLFSADNPTITGVVGWLPPCGSAWKGKLYPGTDVTDQVAQALKDGK